jgi:hypothetical protein
VEPNWFLRRTTSSLSCLEAEITKTLTKAVRIKSMRDITFITTIFGARYSPFLLPHLHTVKKQHPGRRHVLYWNDISRNLIDQASAMGVETVHTETRGKDKHDLLNDRVRLWEEGVAGSNTDTVVVDVDIIFVKPIYHFFRHEITYTFREKHEYPVNLGILLLRDGAKHVEFMSKLTKRTQYLFDTQYEQSKQEYGSCDQQALVELIDGDPNVGGVSCLDLNEVDCHFTERTHAFHYKTGWHPFLLDGEPFPSKGPRSRCRKAYNFWLSVNEECSQAERVFKK